MASVSQMAFYSATKCSFNEGDHQKINRTPSLYATKVDALSFRATVSHSTENIHALKDNLRLKIPQQKQLVDPNRQALIVDGVIYRQTLVIRSYEVGPDKTTTIESILSLFQETALNHVWMTGLLSDGYGATHQMKRYNLIWVVSNMQVEVDHYPLWGETVTIDTWVGASGKNGMRRDWILRSHDTGLVFARGTSAWCMMDRETRRLARMPDKVRAEISQWFTERRAIELGKNRIGPILDNKAKYIKSNIEAKRSDLDVNKHVNNVNYVRWMLESVPDEFQEKHRLTSIRLEYRRECRALDIVQSVCQTQQEQMVKDNKINLLNGFSKGNFEGNELVEWFKEEPLGFTHTLQIKGQVKSEEILRGVTLWKRKPCATSFNLKH